jgi:hypothetical protein
MPDCIFKCKPPECSGLCLDSVKLQCLFNHQTHKVSVAGKQMLRLVLRAEMGAKRRTRVTARKD